MIIQKVSAPIKEVIKYAIEQELMLEIVKFGKPLRCSLEGSSAYNPAGQRRSGSNCHRTS